MTDDTRAALAGWALRPEGWDIHESGNALYRALLASTEAQPHRHDADCIHVQGRFSEAQPPTEPTDADREALAKHLWETPSPYPGDKLNTWNDVVADKYEHEFWLRVADRAATHRTQEGRENA